MLPRNHPDRIQITFAAADVLRTSGSARVLGFTAKVPSTIGTFLRSFSWSHVCQLDRVNRKHINRYCSRAHRASAFSGAVNSSRVV